MSRETELFISGNCKIIFRNEIDISFILSLIKNKNKYSDYDISKLLNNLYIDTIKGCWFRNKDWSIYSTIKINNKSIAAHRVSYELFKEPLKQKQEICHNCDRKGCINPNHLFQGTHSDNIHDAINKKRIYFSPRNRYNTFPWNK